MPKKNRVNHGGVFQIPGRSGWYIDYVGVDGNRHRKEGGDTRSAAASLRAEKVGQLARIRNGLEVVKDNKHDIWELYKAFCAEKSGTVADRTLEDYAYRIPLILKATGARQVCDLTREVLTKFRNRATAKAGQGKLAASTVNGCLCKLKAMLRWAVKYKQLKSNPLDGIEPATKKAARPRRALTDKEVAALLQESPARYRTIWLTYLSTGLRHMELVELRWKDIDLERRILYVRAETSKTAEADEPPTPLPISVELATALTSLKPKREKPDRHVFLNSWGKPWHHNLGKRLRTCLEAAGVSRKGVDIHALRYTFGTMLMADGVDMKTIQTLMRHADISTTMNLYVQPRPYLVNEAVESLDLSNRGNHETTRQHRRKGRAQNGRQMQHVRATAGAAS